MTQQVRFFAPTIPYDIIAAINRMALATGYFRNAMRGAHADYNGHSISVSFNEYRKYWVSDYFWGGRVVLARGEFQTCLQAAMAEYRRGALGSVVHVYPQTLSESVLCQSFPELKVWTKAVESEEMSTWYTWKHRDVALALRERTDDLLASAADEVSYRTECRIRSANRYPDASLRTMYRTALGRSKSDPLAFREAVRSWLLDRKVILEGADPSPAQWAVGADMMTSASPSLQ